MLPNKPHHFRHKILRAFLRCPVSTVQHLHNLHILVKFTSLLLRHLKQNTMIATQSRSRHLQRSTFLQQRLIILCILRKCTVQLKATTHTTRLGETGCVVIDISRRDADGVEAKTVVEVLDVYLLLALGEQFGQVELLLECEVPHAWGGFEAGLVGLSARKGAFSEHHGAGMVWMCCGVGVSDHTADVLPDHVDWRCDFEVVVGYDVEIVCYCDLIIASFGMRGVTCSAVVGRDDSVSGLSEGSYDMAPLIRCVWVAMDEEDDTFLCGALSWAVDVGNSNLSSFIDECIAMLPLLVVNLGWIKGWHVIRYVE